MEISLDAFGFLSILMTGAAITFQALILGGIAFLLLLARPLETILGETGYLTVQNTRRLIGWSACALAVTKASSVMLQSLILANTIETTLLDAMDASFARAGIIAAITAITILAVILVGVDQKKPWILAFLGLFLVTSTVMASHAAARLDDQILLLLANALHQIGAAVWIGGLPCFLFSLARASEGGALRLIGKRYSLMSMGAVTTIVISGVIMGTVYIDSLDALYGTTYGVTILTKAIFFFALLGLGFMNFRTVEKLRRNASTSVLRLRRFAEVEFGVGVTIFLIAASLSSLPPAADITDNRATWAEIAERHIPKWPDLKLPTSISISIPSQKDKQDAEDFTPPEFNYHWEGLFVLGMGILALIERSTRTLWAKHWPLLFLGLAGCLLVRSPPKAWPFGAIGLTESICDPKSLQHRIYLLFVVGFAIFEWNVQIGRLKSQTASLAFPSLSAIGGALLLTHSFTNAKEEALTALTYVPIAVLSVTTGWARWLEIRLPSESNRRFGCIWPICFSLIGVILMFFCEQ
ncbi:copper resistance protein D [Azospirillaceae bacterium]